MARLVFVHIRCMLKL